MVTTEEIGAISIAFSVGGALVAFGIIYGSLKKENDNFKESFKEFKREVKDDVKELREELHRIAKRCTIHHAHRERNEDSD